MRIAKSSCQARVNPCPSSPCASPGVRKIQPSALAAPASLAAVCMPNRSRRQYDPGRQRPMMSTPGTAVAHVLLDANLASPRTRSVAQSARPGRPGRGGFRTSSPRAMPSCSTLAAHARRSRRRRPAIGDRFCVEQRLPNLSNVEMSGRRVPHSTMVSNWRRAAGCRGSPCRAWPCRRSRYGQRHRVEQLALADHLHNCADRP